ncbi:MAG: Uncharacterised protein [Flavobacteriia bacterium]|nr:MAG: Uncharacterised protein [Flavobacteriia bacterium]
MVCLTECIAYRSRYPLLRRDLFFNDHLRVEEQDRANDHAKDHLAEHFEDAPQPFFIFLEHLDVVVQEADEAHPYRGDHEQLDVHIVESGKKQGGNENGREDEETAHGRCPGLFLLPLESEVPNGLAHLQLVQKSDDAFPEQKRDQQGGDHRQGGAEGDVLKHSGTRNVILCLQILKESVEHQAVEFSCSVSTSRSLNGCRCPSISW